MSGARYRHVAETTTFFQAGSLDFSLFQDLLYTLISPAHVRYRVAFILGSQNLIKCIEIRHEKFIRKAVPLIITDHHYFNVNVS